MFERIFAFLPKQPPDWLIGFWTIFGLFWLLGLFIEHMPADLTGQIFYWARLGVALLCLFIAGGLGWRRSHPS